RFQRRDIDYLGGIRQLAAIDALVVEGLAAGGELADATQVVYVSPLKALSNDIRINLEQPLAGIREELA
ncbi:hypothetical protein ACV34S_34965, partial [Pseudomonas aeruginosa]